MLEREAEVGGTARSFRRGGFTFDVTGHWLHLSSPKAKRLVHDVMGDELVELSRHASVYSHGTRTPYPFQANTYGLPIPVVAECVLGYFAAREGRGRTTGKPRSFEDFIRLRLGDGIAKHFMVPYNTKLWTVPPSQMECAWCERFVPTPSPEEVVQGALSPDGAGHSLGYNASFYYPREGGIGRLPERLRQACTSELRLGAKVEHIDWRARRVLLASGESLPYGVLVSSMPLVDLVAALVDPPASMVSAAARLRAASVTYWDIGLAGENGPDDPHWLYFPEPHVPFYRVGAPSAVQKSLAPAGCRSLYVELSHPRGSPVPVSDAQVLCSLAEVGLLAPGESPLVCERTTIDCAYVIMDRAYEAARRAILDGLTRQGILSIGRYGAWVYDSMEGALLMGVEAADRARALAGC